MANLPLRLGTRKSPLALAQAEEAKARLMAVHRLTDDDVRLVTVTASGDRFWIAHDDIGRVAARHPDLALVMLRVQDGRNHAA